MMPEETVQVQSKGVAPVRTRREQATAPSDGRWTAGQKFAVGVAGLSLVMVLAGALLALLQSGRLPSEAILVSGIVYSLFAALIVTRQPRHTVGWLFLVVGFVSSLGVAGSEFDGKIAYDSARLSHALLFLVGNLLWIPSFMIPLTLILQYFPDGRLPSRRWWPIPALSLFGMVGLAASFALAPWPAAEDGIPIIDNPFAIAGAERFLASLGEISQLAFAIGVVGALLTLVARYRRSDSIQRTQMKWLFFTALLGISTLLLLDLVASLVGIVPEAVTVGLFQAMPAILAAAIGIAILRYRLFDIDIIIRRTLQYGIVTALLALVYFGMVVTFQALFAALGDQRSELFIVASTLVIAALFNPVRTRVQDGVDRRFYRRKYHAEKALARFASAARDEVDLERLAAALMEVVGETMQPQQASLALFRKEEG